MTSHRLELLVPDSRAWADWLQVHQLDAEGVWLVLAKKGVDQPTRLTYDEALVEALCHGWIDGQKAGRDELTYLQRFTPRRPRSAWSRRNVELAEQLIAVGRMGPAGLAAVEAAKKDGRWSAAYAGQASMEVPDDLMAALQANPRALAMFDILTSANRYSVCLRVTTAKRPETRSRRIDGFVEMLARGETPHPQKRALEE
jgi:uncharacterized protein YdeI (YjbR/CyaY-like superfamily)